MLYSLQNYRSEPFTADTLRVDVDARRRSSCSTFRASPNRSRVFDQMKLAAKRMAQTLDAALVDDNRRPLDDAALGGDPRAGASAAAAALREVHIEPGSPRALALFGG